MSPETTEQFIKYIEMNDRLHQNMTNALIKCQEAISDLRSKVAKLESAQLLRLAIIEEMLDANQ